MSLQAEPQVALWNSFHLLYFKWHHVIFWPVVLSIYHRPCNFFSFFKAEMLEHSGPCHSWGPQLQPAPFLSEFIGSFLFFKLRVSYMHNMFWSNLPSSLFPPPTPAPPPPTDSSFSSGEHEQCWPYSGLGGCFHFSSTLPQTCLQCDWRIPPGATNRMSRKWGQCRWKYAYQTLAISGKLFYLAKPVNMKRTAMVKLTSGHEASEANVPAPVAITSSGFSVTMASSSNMFINKLSNIPFFKEFPDNLLIPAFSVCVSPNNFTSNQDAAYYSFSHPVHDCLM